MAQVADSTQSDLTKFKRHVIAPTHSKQANCFGGILPTLGFNATARVTLVPHVRGHSLPS